VSDLNERRGYISQERTLGVEARVRKKGLWITPLWGVGLQRGGYTLSGPVFISGDTNLMDLDHRVKRKKNFLTRFLGS